MAISFNKLIRPDLLDINDRFRAEAVVTARAASQKMVFMSHKTGDHRAEGEARYISNKHQLQVYMAEWDADVDGDSHELPDHIMTAIRKSDGFLLHVIEAIAVSMWVGYEIGGAHAMGKSRAKIMYTGVRRLPSVVGALKTLRSRTELDLWIMRYMR